jgi:hypothetical protein
MLRRKLAAALTAAALLTASPAAAFQDEIMYVTTLYSDATYTTVVGHIYPRCQAVYVQYTLVGTYSIYGIDEAVGRCVDGVEQPI